MNAFHVVGACLAIWAVTLAFLGITRENFPASPAGERLVAAISILLVAGAIGSAIYVGATEGKKQSPTAGVILPL